MDSKKHFGRSLLLVMLAVGMNALCFGFAHGHSSRHASHINYSHIPPHGSHRPVSRTSRVQRVLATDTSDHADLRSTPHHVTWRPIVPQPIAAIASVATLPEPQRVTLALAQAPVIALGSAPRAPGLGRAPPIA